MNYYQEIRLLPNAEANLGFLWHKVFQQIHIALVEHQVEKNRSEIGLSMPDYFVPSKDKRDFPLGDKIRLFANSQQELEKLNIAHWLLRYEDYAQVKSIKSVPENVQHACFSRRHKKGQNQIAQKTLRLAEFKASKTGESVEKHLAEYEATAPVANNKLPYIFCKSLSGGGDAFPLFIEMQVKDTAQPGEFNCYGLSVRMQEAQATVPWF